MSNYLKITNLLLAAALIVAGCGKGGSGTPAAGEAELFAKAQELQKDEKFDEAIRTYRQLVREFPKTKQGANSQFMIGYIYANHVKDYEQGKIELQRFIDKFSSTADSGLIAGAKFELQWMGKDIEDIPILANIGESSPKTDTTADRK